MTSLAIPLTAALTLNASPAQMGFLRAAQTVPYILFGMVAGAWVDRSYRKPILIRTDIARAVVLAIIPIAAILGILRLELLYTVGVVAGSLSVFFDAAYRAYLPSIVDREQLLDGNSKLEMSRSGAQVAAPGLAGALLQFMSAPMVIVFDSLSFLVSAAAVLSIPTSEPDPSTRAVTRSLWVEAFEGLRVVLQHPILRSIALCSTTINFFSSAITALLVFYITRDVGMSASSGGVILMAANVGFLLGAVFAAAVAARIGQGRAIFYGAALTCIGQLLYAIAGGPLLLTGVLLSSAQFIAGFGVIVYNVNQTSLRQYITPDRLQGRVNAVVQMLSWFSLPFGALLGGSLSAHIGTRFTLGLCASAVSLCLIWLVTSPIVRITRNQEIPANLILK